MASRPPEPAAVSRLDGDLLARLRGALLALDAAQPAAPGAQLQAAVLLLFDPSSERLPLLFVLRSPFLRHHAGQIGFPGGTVEPADADLVATALREANEEVGLDPANVDVVGKLHPFLTAVSDRWLTPFVGLQRGPWQVRGDDHEVAEWFRVDLTALLEAPHTVRELEREGVRRSVHFYDAGGRVIWGVTAAILHELMHRIGRRD